MSDHFISDKDGLYHTIITMADIYQVKGFTFVPILAVLGAYVSETRQS